MALKSVPGVRSHVAYLAGLRGWAAHLVFFTHIREIFFGDLRMIVHRGMESHGILGQAADALYNLIFNSGQLAVYTFWTLSGYVLSLSYFRLRSSGKVDALGPWARQRLAGRYFRLYLPVAAVCLVAFLLGHLGLFQNARLSQTLGPAISDTARFFIDFRPGIFETLWFSFVQCPFEFKREFDPPLWSISYELWGSVLVFTLLAIFGTHPRRFLVYALVAVAAMLLQPLYLSFLLGVALADVHSSKGSLKDGVTRWILLLPVVLVALIGGEVWTFAHGQLLASSPSYS